MSESKIALESIIKQYNELSQGSKYIDWQERIEAKIELLFCLLLNQSELIDIDEVMLLDD